MAEATSGARRETVGKAEKVWTRRLIDLTRRNNLLYFRPLKNGTLNLSLADGDRMAALLSGDSVSISRLTENPEDEKLKTCLRDIWRRAQANAEEKGLATLFVALGMATWTAGDGGRDPDAPILLLPVTLEQKGHLGQSYSVRRTGTVQVNLVLLNVLATDFGIAVAADELIPLLQGDDEGEIFDPGPVYQHLTGKCPGIAGFQVRNVAVLGNFAFQKLAMVNDIRENESELIANDLVAAMAGDVTARTQIASAKMDADPREFDRVPPQNEYLILDADSSQQQSIATVLKGQSAVVHGPPGTGKSQTIANLIASLAVQGQRVLFVAEKRAALEVVRKRLKEVGLENIVIDMHGADVSPRLVLEQVGRALESVRASTPVDCGDMHQKFVERRERLNRHVERLHAGRALGGQCVYEMQGAILKLARDVSSTTRWRGTELAKINTAGPQKVRDHIKEGRGFASLLSRTDSSPWTGARLPTGQVAQKAIDLARQTSSQTWPDFESAVSELTDLTRFGPPATLQGVKEISDLLARVKKTLAIYSGGIYSQNPAQMARNLKPGCGGMFPLIWAWISSGAFRQARKQAFAIRTAGKAPLGEIYDELCAADAALRQWFERSARRTNPSPIPDCETRLGKIETLFVAIAELETLGPRKNLPQVPLGELRNYIDSLAQDALTPLKLPKLCEIESGIEGAGASKLIDEIRATKCDSVKWETLFDHAWLSSCLDAAFAEDPDLAGFNGRTHDGFVAEFMELDQERIRTAVARVKRACAERAIAEMNAHPDQETLVRAETQKKRRLLPLRKLFAQAHEVLTAVCPCWMASPLSVSQLLDGKHKFDFVIFDEASQVLPEDAIPAVLRAKHLVVAGDSNQLPPTTFFAAGEDDASTDEEPGATEGFESLLDTANAFVPSTYLNWHYRSRDESLITFSNFHIYSGRLVTFPSPGGPPALRHVLVKQPPGVDGQEESSAAEVQKVVELVIEHAEKRPAETLGVIAMGIRHADRVQRALDAALESRHDLAQFFDPERPERFFVKNLERVQGDERDAIIMTVGYGKDRGGNLPFRFGPLLSQGGQRRLNVAITRARSRMTVVSSFSHSDMNPERIKAGTGVELMRFYLQYAATEGRKLSDASPTGIPLNPFEAEVYDTLQSKGIPLIPQMGESHFRLDFVARHPKEPGRFVLAIECDGASYHSSPTARDRDRLRQQQLENLGWRFLRIWSTDWFMRKEEEVARALAAFAAAVEFSDAHRSDSATNPAAAEIEQQTTQPPHMANLRGPRPIIPKRESITDYRDVEILEFINWINSDGRLRTDEEMVEELVAEMGFSRRGPRIEATLRSFLGRTKQNGPSVDSAN